MKLFAYALDKFGGISKAILRFWAVFLCLLTITTLDIISIESQHDFEKQIMTLVVGSFCFLCAQGLSERFGKTFLLKCIFHAAAALVLTAYYAYVLSINSINDVIGVKTVVGIFALFIAFIWIPSIRRSTDFYSIFLCVFKSFFISAFFSGIIFGGISAIIAAINALLLPVSSHAYAHTANIVWVLWAPMLFLSLIPAFSLYNETPEKIKKSIGYPHFLEVLLSYVLIPLISIYTLVLLLYMGKTIYLGNWNDNLLEPLILTYLIAVLLLYVLVKHIDNISTRLFRKIFPVLLAAIALYQTISSIVKAFDEGIVFTRYFVILFSLYSLVCGILLFLFPKKKNDVIAWLAILLALVSITPYMGAFGVSSASQSAIVENTLEKNGMLQNGGIIPKSDVSDQDKKNISRGVSYLNSVNDLDKLAFLPNNFDYSIDFKNVFGFDLYHASDGNNYISKEYQLDPMLPIDTKGYDYLLTTSIHSSDRANRDISNVTIDDQVYKVSIINIQGEEKKMQYQAGDTVIMSISLTQLCNKIAGYKTEIGILAPEKLTFDFENNDVKVRIIFRYASIYANNSPINHNAEFYILYSVK
jgi:MFS family permease